MWVMGQDGKLEQKGQDESIGFLAFSSPGKKNQESVRYSSSLAEIPWG